MLRKNAAISARAPIPETDRLRVAVLDDGHVSQMLRTDLGCTGTTVILINEPADLRGVPVDTVILDVSPKGVPKIELIGETLATAPQTKVIATTAYPNFRLAIDVIKAGAVDCLAKPLRVSDIERVLGLTPPTKGAPPPLRMPSLARVEWEYLSEVLALVNGNLSAGARVLGIERSTLQRKLKKNPPNW